jgi:hypothetical protein
MAKLPTVTLGKATSQTPSASFGPATGQGQAPLRVPGITPGAGGVRKLTLQQAISQAGADTPALVIEELTGFKRRVTLKARGLPFPGSIKFCTELDMDESKYVGFPRINQTVLSVHDKETEMTGAWHERFLDEDAINSSAAVNEQLDDGSEAVSVQSNGIRTPVEACELFDDIARRASVLRVTWSHLSRVGRLATFEQDWSNLHDVKWRMLFKWIGKDNAVGAIAPARTSLVGLSAAFSAAFADAKDATAFDSLSDKLDTGFADSVDSAVGKAQRSVADIADTVEQRFAAVTESVDAVRRVTTLATFVRDQAQDLIDTINGTVAALMLTGSAIERTSLDRTLATLTNVDPGTQIAAACQQVGAVRAARALKHVAARQRHNALRNLDNNVIAIVRMKAQQDLRDVALRWYGNADDWEQIRSFNSFPSSQVKTGTVVFVPALNPT